MLKTLITSAALAAVALQPAMAEPGYPSKPIRMIVPFAPGGSTDVVARILGAELKNELGQAVIVENKPGAGGNIGGDAAAKATPDGYTILMAAAGPTVINPSLYSKMPYDPIKDLAPVTMLVREHNLMAINPSIPAKTLQEFISYAKSKPNEVNFGSPGNGSPAQLAGQLMNQTAGLKMVHVAYKGSGPAVVDLVAGHISMMIDNMPALLPHVQSGKLRALAIPSESRASAMPDVPTFAEAGMKDFVITAWKGVMVPAGTPPAVVNKLQASIAKIMAKPDIKKRMIEMGAEPVANTPEQFGDIIKKESKWWAALVKSTGTKLE
ncbi:tripartite tricarboxylate transporter substrate binding protein [Noviherbaspirillum sp. CPCC 100848]|uniref:Tripartite tricarboxylate transporter substrate binding protein n=1 Tax=Noviherbaspirillum album TaxID=3080276 RepID=A0ABU6JCI8_9BURK|nr:tripartite tricarboxylate transporter substrate binding protein [Noviherbaspirillum sp. CPCC 100848]MEC4720957.1 tripartite tricarboxylate transporter substrate binding protein [Noviherbaspirillum sp. CPCC 100848]